MKKFLVLAIAAVCLATGCTKEYDSVEEYAKDMKAVQQAQKSYALEFETLSLSDMYYQSYIKKDLWKYSMSSNHGKNYMFTVLNDGKNTVMYNNSSKWANETKMGNIASELLDWDKPNSFYVLSGNKFEFVDNNAKMNGFNCRLIKYGDNYEACINDKLGIAVYLKIKYKNTYLETVENITNLLKADTKELPDSTFVLPSDKQIVTLQDKLKQMSKGKF
ncbi:hypothetical protein J6S88_01430 [bacterium]|nr:hypothetical protein [bacterium]